MNTQSFQDVPNPLPVTSDDRGHTPYYYTCKIVTCHEIQLKYICAYNNIYDHRGS